MFSQILFSPQVKRCVIITYKHGTYELLHGLLDDLRLRIIGNYRISGNYLNFTECWFPSQNESFVDTIKNYSNMEIKLFRLCAILDEN